MSKITQTASDIKKKLSFNDYSSPSNQQAVQTVVTHTIMPVYQHDSAQSQQHNGAPLLHSTGEPASRGDGIESCQHASSESRQTASLPPKKKVTYYLSEEDEQIITDIYIKRLQSKNKTDKSALIAEAIHLLAIQESM